MKEGRKPEYMEKTPGNELQKMPLLVTEVFYTSNLSDEPTSLVMVLGRGCIPWLSSCCMRYSCTLNTHIVGHAVNTRMSTDN